MRKGFKIAFLIFIIITDLLFITGTCYWYSEDKDKIWQYVRLHPYEEKLEDMYPGKVQIYYTESNSIYLKIYPEITLDDCLSIAAKFQDWRIHDSALYDFKYISMFPAGVYVGCPCGLCLRSVVSISYDENSSDIVDINIASQERISALGSKLTFLKGNLSSFRIFKNAFGIRTGIYIEIDEESGFFKMEKWDCPPGLYTEEQIAELEARGISPKVLGEEAAA